MRPVLALWLVAACEDGDDGWPWTVHTGVVAPAEPAAEEEPPPPPPAPPPADDGCGPYIVCNDGTCSPSCTSCSQGCCSSHDGCL